MAPPQHHGLHHQHEDSMDPGKQRILEHIDKVHEDIREYLMKVAQGHGEETAWMSASRFFYGDYNHVSEAKVLTISCVILLILLAVSLATVVIVCIVKRRGGHCKGCCNAYDRQTDEKVQPVGIYPNEHPKTKEALESTGTGSNITGSDTTEEVTQFGDLSLTPKTPPPLYNENVSVTKSDI